MHNNFYFLRQLTRQLTPTLADAVVSECFSQSRDELVVRFETTAAPFIVRASLLPELSCLSFPETFHRARKNSVDLFGDLVGRRVTGLRQYRNERCFSIGFGDYDLLFKMHGNRTNVVLFHHGRVRQLFRNKITADQTLSLETLDRDIDWSFDRFVQHDGNAKALYFTFGKVVWDYLQRHSWDSLSPRAQWELINTVRALLENPSYYIIRFEAKPVLSLLEAGEVMQTAPDPVSAANAYYHNFVHTYALAREKHGLLNVLRSRMAAGQNYAEKNRARLAAIGDEGHYRIWGDLLMANLHAIPRGAEKVTLENFYAGNRPAEIRLKKDLSPQKNAEIYYRKAKNQHIETKRLRSAIRQKQDELKQLGENIRAVEDAPDVKTLRALKAALGIGEAPQGSETLPYHEFTFMGYRIWVGRNAQANDTLTFKLGYKEDLWLHARDVSGSHVLIKHQAGKKIPADVIRFAASLAAYHSKRRNESLCPVIVTPRKFVRKRKGDPAGAVIVEREEVLMVPPSEGN